MMNDKLIRKIIQAKGSVFTHIVLVFLSLLSVLIISPFITAIRTNAVPAEYRSIDGSGNNVTNANYGTPGTQLIRLAAPAYDDHISTPRGGYGTSSLPNPRTISNKVAAQRSPEDRPNTTNTTNMVFQWGQFLDHDIDLTEGKEEDFSITVPPDDDNFPQGSIIRFSRSIFDPETGTTTPRQQINEITAWIDASNVYGSDESLASSLREFKCGRLKTSKNFNLLPSDADGNFIAGDIRSREQTGLVAMHTLFMREHNRLANLMCKKYKKDPSWDDEKIYQEARKYVGAEMQKITYNEFLPVLLGSDGLPPYSGYKSTVDPSIANEFSTGAFRFGHSMVPEQMWLLKSNGKSIPYGNLPLADAFFKPNEFLYPNTLKGIESVIRGLVKQPHMGVDNMIVDAVRNFLFGAPGAGGFDLASLNIQRGRDHGLPGYNAVRTALGLTEKTFSEVSSNPDVNSKLESVYSSPNAIDLWVGGLGEDPINGGLVGETFHAIIRDQFIRLRDGDRFWYENPGVFANEQLNELKNTSLADIITRNTKIKAKEMGDSAFNLS